MSKVCLATARAFLSMTMFLDPQGLSAKLAGRGVNSFAESPWPTTIFLTVVTVRSGLYRWAHSCRGKLLLYRYASFFHVCS